MKKSAIFFRTVMFSLILLFILTSSSQTTYAQSSEKQEKENAKIEAIKQMVETRRFVFLAQSARPMSARTIQLNSDYNLKIKKDTIQCDLPYYGRAYTASPGDAGGGISFKTTDFEYSSKDGSKGGWDITIAPKDIKNVNRMLLSISNSGYASLQVTSNTRQTISFNGVIAELK